jgi:hypothetical protein
VTASDRAQWPLVSGRPPLIGLLDPPADRYLRSCVAVLERALAANLVGTHLYSSAAVGDFIPGRSDLDVVVVVRRPLARDPALALADELCAVVPPFPTKGLDLTVVTLDSARTEQPTPRVELKVLTFFGDARTADDEPDGDTRVVMHFACCRDHGIALTGPPPREVFAPVSLPDYLIALGRELNRAWMPPHYIVLNACRDLRFIEEGVICSKVGGALWALGQGYDPWLIEAALGWQVDGIGPVIDGNLVDEFVAKVAARLAAAPERLGQARGHGASTRPRRPDAAEARAALGQQPEHFPLSPHEAPLVSCVLAGSGDRAAAIRAAGWFAAQDYPARELIVVAPASAVDELRQALPADPAIRVLAAPSASDVGAARDTGCAHAGGDLIALWDENAWYAPWRLGYQAGALMRTSHDTSASTGAIAWDPVAGECWAERSAPVVGSRPLVAATVCLTRSAWTRWPFTARCRGKPDDQGLLDPTATPVHVPRGAHFAVLVKPGAYFEGVHAVRYPADAAEVLLGPAVHMFTGLTEAVSGAFGSPAAALVPPALPPVPPAPLPRGPAAERLLDPPLAVPAFAPEPEPDEATPGVDALRWARLPRATPGAAWVPARSVPQVSCIMPTFNRRRFIAQARRNLLRQDYPQIELVVIDDGTEPLVDLLDGLPNCRYVRIDERVTIGHKRNVACEIARGDIVVQWDDDDWYGPHRVSRQVREIVDGNADATGIGVNLLLDVRSMRMWSTREREAADPVFASIEAVAGGTLAYTKDLWRQVGGYPDASIGEDVGLMRLMADAGARIAPISNQGAYVYIRHGRNSWRYDFDPGQGPAGWNPSTPPAAMESADLAFYASLGVCAGLPPS